MIRTTAKKILRPPVLFLRRYRAKSILKRAHILSHKSKNIRSVGEAIQDLLTQDLSSEERRFITLIENRRSLLLKSNEEISVIDFGAGSGDSKRSKEEMEMGVRSTALVSDICKASKDPFQASLLFKLIRKLKPLSCVELGTCVGISAAYLSSALKMNGTGKLFTLEGAPELAQIATETLDSLSLNNASIIIGPFHDTLTEVLESSKPIDFFFNDGHHDHDALLSYFDETFPNLSNEATIVFDDIAWSEGMKRAWNKIENDDRVSATIDLSTMGIAFIGNNATKKEKIKIPI